MSFTQNDSDSESEDDFEERFSGRDAYVFVIDALLYDSSQEFFNECLYCIRDSMLNGILTREKDLFGVILCNTAKSPLPKDKEGIETIVIHKNNAVILPLKPLSKSTLEYYISFCASDDFDFKDYYGCEQGSFHNTIWLCTNMFKQCGYKLSTQYIIYFTDKETPHEVSSNDFQVAMQKANDLKEIDINFKLIPMKENFNYEIFYKEFICMVRGINIDNFKIPNPEKEKNYIVERLFVQNYRKHCYIYLRWTIGDDLIISVGMYNCYKRNIYPKSIKIFREDNSIATVKHVFKIGLPGNTEDLNEKYCLPADQRKVIYNGGEKIVFTNEERTKLQGPVQPGLKLLGFKPKTAISLYNYVTSSAFLYPDETTIAGSTKLFRALWQRCYKNEKIALCILVARRKTPPHYVALIPVGDSLNHSDEFKDKDIPTEKDGFSIVYLPCKIDIRDLNISNRCVPEIPIEGIDLFEKVVKKLNISYKPTFFNDPSLKLLLDDISALQFDIERKKTNDNSAPDVEKQDQQIQPFIDEIMKMFEEKLEISRRRKADDSDQSQASSTKSAKLSCNIPTTERIDYLISNEGLDVLTANELRSFLKMKNVKGISSATKQNLIKKILELHEK